MLTSLRWRLARWVAPAPFISGVTMNVSLKLDRKALARALNGEDPG